MHPHVFHLVNSILETICNVWFTEGSQAVTAEILKVLLQPTQFSKTMFS